MKTTRKIALNFLVEGVLTERKRKILDYFNIPYKHRQIKEKARATVYINTRNGNLNKTPCMVCGKEKVDAHHNDYTKPLEIIWLCHKHHIELHHKKLSTILII